MSSTAPLNSAESSPRHRILQGVHLHRQQGELTGYSFQIRLLRCRALRQRRQHSCVLLLRHLNIPQSRPDDRIWYWDWDWSRLGWRLCSDPIEIRRREAAEVRQRETIKTRQGKLVEIRQGEAIETRKGIGGGGTNDGQGGQGHRYRRHPVRSHLLCPLGPFVSLRFLIPCFGHLRSLRLSPVARFFPVAGHQERVAWIQQRLRARVAEFGSNHGLVWLMLGYARDPPARAGRMSAVFPESEHSPTRRRCRGQAWCHSRPRGTAWRFRRSLLDPLFGPSHDGAALNRTGGGSVRDFQGHWPA